MSAAADDLARRVAAFLPVPLPSPPQQKQQLSAVAAAVLDAWDACAWATSSAASASTTPSTPAAARRSSAGATPARRMAGDDRRPERRPRSARRRPPAAATTPSAPPLGPVLFVRDTTLLFPVHLSKRHLIWYGFERKNGVHSVCPAYWSAHKRWFFMSMLCLNPFACSFMDMQFPNGQLRYVAGDGFTTRAFLPLRGGILQAHGKFPGEKRLSFSFKNRSGGSVVPMVQWPDKSLALGIVQALSWRTSGLMLQPATQISICPTIGGRHPGVCMELIHSANDNVGIVCGYSHTASPSAYASISIGRSKLNGGAARSGLVFRVDAPLHGFGRPWFSVQMNSGIEF
ncbi:unnamed protein product [Miscanthus lutarioriparius]|uniref:Uncharacterized protein n=1 Tax=Miscanthus lutarioriparius TaxID=422564 RepID=A0A811S9F5_9POAL|nr:unnamed protein product [Miscanthus lutarioriparius]